MMVVGALVMCPPATSLALHQKSSMLMSNIINTNVLHLRGNGVSPEGITILLVELKGFFDGLRLFNAKFMGPFQIRGILFSYKRNNAVPLPQESWFMVSAQDLSIISCFNRVRLIKVSKIPPRRRAFLPLAASCQPMVEHFR